MTESVIGSDPPRYFPVSLSTLRVDQATGFPLYLRMGQAPQPVLYRAPEVSFSMEDVERLKASKVETLYVPTDQFENYRHYVEKNLSSILADPTVPMEMRSTLLYASARELVQDVLKEPRSPEALERSAAMVDNTVSFLFNDNNSFYHLMKVSSFDYYTYTHSVNVLVFFSGLAQRLGFSQEDIQRYGQGALLHDVGKSQMSSDIINCRGALSEEQWVVMRNHPVYGHDILVEQGITDTDTLSIVRHHHEKMTGQGYPDKLAADEINPWARICTIADIFDALTTKRSYKDALDSFPSLQLMRQKMYEDIDKDFFKVFVELMGKAGAPR